VYSFTKEQLVNKIEQDYGIDKISASSIAKKTMEETPEKFYQNICEWIEERELTEIYARKYSVKMIMTLWKRQDFLEALSIVSEIETGDAGTAELRIWNMRR
jgi:hypothetical protein